MSPIVRHDGSAHDPSSAAKCRELLGEVAADSKSRTQLWTSFLGRTALARVAEVGVWKGDFAAAMLAACPAIDTYVMIDPWRHLDEWNKPANVAAGTFEGIRAEAMAKTEFGATRRQVLRGTTLEVVDSIDDGSLDFAYIDGDHTLRGIVTDLVAMRPKIRAGGFLAGDDFCPNVWQHGAAYEPTLVFPVAVDVALAMRATIFALPFNQFLIVLPNEGERGRGAFVDLVGAYPTLDLGAQVRPPRPGLGDRLRDALSAVRGGTRPRA
ncbi:MAG TPA: class I SAM-dependent methyltransferase [Gemmatimonadaceae bacterium]